MKKTYELNCGDVIRFESESPAGVVAKLESLRSYDNSKGDEFIRSSAKMFSMYYGKSIRFDNPEVFAEDLVIAGLLKEVTDENSA